MTDCVRNDGLSRFCWSGFGSSFLARFLATTLFRRCRCLFGDRTLHDLALVFGRIEDGKIWKTDIVSNEPFGQFCDIEMKRKFTAIEIFISDDPKLSSSGGFTVATLQLRYDPKIFENIQ